MKLNKQFFDTLEKQIEKDWGKKCWKHIHSGEMKNYSPLCGVCQVWLAYCSLRDLYGIDYREMREQDKPRKKVSGENFQLKLNRYLIRNKL